MQLHMEEHSRKRARRGQLERIVLSSLALAGIAGLTLAAPNTLRLLKHIDNNWILKRDPVRRLREVAHRLKRKRFVEWVNEDGKTRMRINAAGKRYLENLIVSGQPLQKPKRWDGKWRLVIFDIPEKRRGIRNKVRETVSGFGFARLQDSVWVYPYDCEEVIALLKNDLRVSRDMRYIIADATEYDTPLRRHFELR